MLPGTRARAVLSLGAGHHATVAFGIPTLQRISAFPGFSILMDGQQAFEDLHTAVQELQKLGVAYGDVKEQASKAIETVC